MDRPRFDLPHFAYYFGALVVISAMTWFMTLGWERFGSGGILAISLSYALGFIIAGALLWRDKGLKVPGGRYCGVRGPDRHPALALDGTRGALAGSDGIRSRSRRTLIRLRAAERREAAC